MAGIELLPTGSRPHYTARLESDSDEQLTALLATVRAAPRQSRERNGRLTAEEVATMITVDITADLNDEDETGLCGPSSTKPAIPRSWFRVPSSWPVTPTPLLWPRWSTWSRSPRALSCIYGSCQGVSTTTLR